MNTKTVVTGVVVFLIGSAFWELLGKPFIDGMKQKLAPSPEQHKSIMDSIFG